MNQVAGMSRCPNSLSSRSAPTAPNSPREIGVGVVWPRAMNSDKASKSNVRQTIWRDTDKSFLLRSRQRT